MMSMKIALGVSVALLVLSVGYWFDQETNRLKINSENETSTGIEQRLRSVPADSIERKNDLLYSIR